MPGNAAPARTRTASCGVGGKSVSTVTLCQGALLRAIESGVSVCDTLFVELAARSACTLLTFDKAMLKAFPDIARQLKPALMTPRVPS